MEYPQLTEVTHAHRAESYRYLSELKINKRRVSLLVTKILSRKIHAHVPLTKILINKASKVGKYCNIK